MIGNLKYLEEIKQLSSDIWHNPELAFNEHGAHDKITDFFERNKIGHVSTHYLLDTAFKVEVQTGRKDQPNNSGDKKDLPCVAFFSEYDALPYIGHACGHNLIAIVGVYAFIETVTKLEKEGISARVVLLGSPGEEGGGGKILMMEKGALKGVDLALMAHPSAINCCLESITLALDELKAMFHGESVHGVVPWQGRNALDAAVLAYTNVNSLRHRMHPSMRAHGIFTDGGKAPNVIPERAELWYYFRAVDKVELKGLTQQAIDCFKAAAMATGCTVDIDQDAVSYDSVVQNQVLGRIYTEYMKELGYKFPAEGDRPFRGSTDMGDVSRVVPSIHPWFSVPCDNAPGHSIPFREAANSPESFKCALDAAICLSKTAVTVLMDAVLFAQMKNCFKQG